MRLPSAIVRRLGPLAVQGEFPVNLENTRFGPLPWDLRTFIAVMPPEAPFRFLNLNWVLGRSGMGFDQVTDRSRRRAREVVDLQCCLELADRAVTHKGERPISTTSWSNATAEVSIGDSLKVTGSRPSYRIVYRQPEADLELDIELDCLPGLMHWVRLQGIYCHYTTFVSATIRGLGAPITTPALLDHGWGRHALPLRIPTGWFRYEVLRLPDDILAIALRVEAPGGFEVVTAAALYAGPNQPLRAGTTRSEVLEWQPFTNFAGEPRRLPARWRNTLDFGNSVFSYTSTAAGTPHTVLGDGFLQAVQWQGKHRGLATSGAGYVEQLGNP